MIWGLSMKSVFSAGLGLVALALSACSAINSSFPTPTQINAITKGEGAAIVMQLSGSGPCPMLDMTLRDTRTGRSFQYYVDGAVGFVPRPAVIMVPPGSYQFDRANCINGGYTHFPAVGAWFDDIEVAQGEVVYVGRLDADLITQEAFSRYNDPVSRFLFGSPGEGRSFYMSYTLTADPNIRDQVAYFDPALGQQLVVRVPEQRINEERFITLIAEAYAPGPDGRRPVTDVANRRLAELMNAEYGDMFSVPRDGAGPK